MAAPEEEGIISLRLSRPGGEGEIEIIIEKGRKRKVDAVFTSRSVVDRILIPFYETTDMRRAEELREAVEAQQKDDVCLVLHMRMCSFLVPAIDWDATSPIRV
jgi:hypothetical protein